MSIVEIKNTAIRGVSSCVPKESLSNLDYDYIGLRERELLVKTTGVKNRRVASSGTCASDLCFKAANNLLANLNWESSSVDLLIMVTQSPDHFLPATSAILHERLNLSKSCLAFDVNLGCSGFVYGLHIIGSMLQNGQYKRALLLAGDVSTNSTNPRDKSAYPLFGDAGSAAAIEYSEAAPSVYFGMGTDGSGHESIIIKGGGTRIPYNEDSFKEKRVSEGVVRNELNLCLEGIDVFTFAIKAVPKEINAMLGELNVKADDISSYVLHQANKLINDTIRKKMKQPADKFLESLSDFGNTSSASIPLTLCKNPEANYEKTVLSGFGVGLSWATAIADLSQTKFIPIIEFDD